MSILKWIVELLGRVLAYLIPALLREGKKKPPMTMLGGAKDEKLRDALRESIEEEIDDKK